MSLSEGLSFLLKDAMAMYRLISGLCEEDDLMRRSGLHDAMAANKDIFDGLAVDASGARYDANAHRPLTRREPLMMGALGRAYHYGGMARVHERPLRHGGVPPAGTR